MRATMLPCTARRTISRSMKACGVDLQPPRLPTSITRARRRVFEHAAVDQIVEHHDVGARERFHRLEREQFRISGPRADQINFAGLHVAAASFIVAASTV